MKKAKLAVVIPVYNGEATLEKSLQCIADQEYTEFEAFILENQSTDRSIQVARSFCERDKRFKIIECEDHRDAHGNLLRALELGREKGEYFCLRPCDDLSSADYISRLIGALEADHTKLLAVGSTDRISEGSAKEHRPDRATVDFYRNLQRGRVAKSMHFPSEWFYGVYRSNGGAEIVIRRWKDYRTPWCVASYCVAEFVMRGLVVWVDGPKFYFFEGSGSDKRYMVSSLREMIRWRLKYALGCYAAARELPELSPIVRIQLFKMCWNDAGRKTRYRLRKHIKDTTAKLLRI